MAGAAEEDEAPLAGEELEVVVGAVEASHVAIVEVGLGGDREDSLAERGLRWVESSGVVFVASSHC